MQPLADAVTRNTATQVVLVHGDIVRRYLRQGGGSDHLCQVIQDIAQRNLAVKRGQPIRELPE